MSQQEIIDLLENTKEPLTLSQICLNLCQDKAKVSRPLKKLIHYKEISYTEIDHTEAKKYGSKRRMRLYYINNVTYIIMLTPIFIHFI